MNQVLWFSRHQPLPSQISKLKELYGEDLNIKQYGARVSSADDIVSLIKKEKPIDYVIVAPLSVLAVLSERKIHPLYAQMTQVPVEEAEVTVGNRGFIFKEFKRIKEVKIEFYDSISDGK